MLKKARKLLKSNSGFTILELIVVIAIMGFLVALVAPRLVGVSESARQPTCETNQQRLSDGVERMVTESGGFPNNLKSLIPVEWHDTDYAQKVTAGGPVVKKTSTSTVNDWINDGDTKAEFTSSFADGNHIYVHRLNSGEVTELKKMGITNILDYKTGKSKAIGTANDANTIADVLMIGGGASGTGDITDGAKKANSTDPDITFTNPDLMYRIVLGAAEGSDLMEKNVLSSLGTCPSAMQNSNVDYKNYSVVLPRLASTVLRLPTKTAITADGSKSDNTATAAGRTFYVHKSQTGSWTFDIMCPEGKHLWPSTDVVKWTIRSGR